MKRKSIRLRLLSMALVIVMVMAFSVVPAFATTANSSTTTQQTTVNYDATDNDYLTSDWTWTVPATQTFTNSTLVQTGDVAISPADSGKSLVLATGTNIAITMASANGFMLKNTDASSFGYKVFFSDSYGSTPAYNTAISLSNDAEVLKFTAGTSDNSGISRELTFMTSADETKKATLVGAHTDTVTFTVNVTTA